MIYGKKGTGAWQQIGTVGNTVRTFTWNGVANGINRWYVVATNGTKTKQSDTWSFTYTPLGNITGTVKNDPNQAAVLVGGVCQLAGATGVRPGTGSTVTVGSNSGNVATSGSYSVTTPTGAGNVAVLNLGDPNNWICTCPTNCQYSTTSPKSGLDYFVSNVREAWFQVTGGSLHANGGGVRSKIPATCTGACSPYLIKADSSSTVGVVSYQSGSLNLGDVGTNNVSNTSQDWWAVSEYKGLQTGYDYFARILADDPTEITN
ncbi:MAG: hypothetical protein WD740_05410 [Anaerolineales bacterium]